MLMQVEIPIGIEAGEQLNYSVGSLLHGAMMEVIAQEDAERLHEMGLRPYSQGIYWDRKRNLTIWRFNVLNRTAHETILLKLLKQEKLYLRHRRQSIQLSKNIIESKTSYRMIADDIFKTSEAPSGAEMEFLTPTSFKHDGRYVIWPELSLIWKSLMQRWNAFSPLTRIEEDNLAARLAEESFISRYNLHTQPYSLEGRNIYGFSGRITIRFSGNDMGKRVLGLLSAFASFAGIGIKTALGMGMVRTKLHRKDKIDE